MIDVIRTIGLCLLISLPILGQGQSVHFQRNTQTVQNQPTTSTLPLAVTDVNGDGWDDIVSMDQGVRLTVQLSASNRSSLLPVPVAQNADIAAWAMSIGDLDNNGINDIVLSAAASGIHVFEWSQTEQIVKKKYRISDSFFPQASNLVDLNDDGFLDLFVCNDDGLSKVFFNNAQGYLIPNPNFLDMSTITPSDNSGNYGSAWTDIDSDGDLDLYLSKCRAGVTDPTDPRRVNALYLNDSSNNFSEAAASLGLDIGDQSWVSRFADFDHDGDQDMVVINHYASHAIYENIDNHSFAARPELLDSTHSAAFQVHVADFDNNRFEDILITGDKSFIFWNNGGLNFTKQEQPFGSYELKSSAIGDLNRDGNLDIFGSIGDGINNPGWIRDQVFQGQANGNNYVSFRLLSENANRNGVTATVHVIGPWGDMSKTLNAGESYGVSNSLNLHFGLGTYQSIPELRVVWSDGQTQSFTDVAANTFYQIKEGGCIVQYRDLDIAEQAICAAALTLPPMNTKNFSWFVDRQHSEDLLLTQAQVIFGNDRVSACDVPYNPIYISETDELLSEVFGQDTVSLCSIANGAMNLPTDPELDYVWDDGSTSTQRTIENPGRYQVSWDDQCGVQHSDAIVVQDNDAQALNLDTLPPNPSLSFVSTSPVTWYSDESSTQPLHFGDNFDIGQYSDIEELWAQSYDSAYAPEITVGESTPTGISRYSGSGQNGGLYFNVAQDLILDQIDVYTDTPGTRQFMIINANGDTISQHTQDLINGKNIIDFSAVILKGDAYYMTTDSSTNQQLLGTDGPRLERSFETISYPYEVENQIDIYNSNFGPSYYQHFFNWNLRPYHQSCSSQRVLVYEAKVVDACQNLKSPKFILFRFDKRTNTLILNNRSILGDIELVLHESSVSYIVNPERVSSSNGNTMVDLSQFSEGLYRVVMTDSESNRLTLNVNLRSLTN